MYSIVDHVFRCSLWAVVRVDDLSSVHDRFTLGKFFIFRDSLQRHLSRYSVWPIQIIKIIWLSDFS